MNRTSHFPIALFGLLFAVLAIGVASCDKEEPQTSIATTTDEPMTLKSASCDTVTFSGTFLGVKYEKVTIIFDHEACTFTFEGDVVVDGDTYHVSGSGEIKTHTFNGTITDSLGQSVDVTQDWVDIIFRPVEFLLKATPQIGAIVIQSK